MIVFDLDDTLYPERDYVLSAYHAIDRHIHRKWPDLAPDAYKIMSEAFESDKNPFDALLAKFCPWTSEQQAVKELLEIYRYHNPELTLYEDTKTILEHLKRQDIKMAVITDGRARTQRAKADALKLYNYIQPEDFIISEETGFDKHSDYNFRLLMQKHPNEGQYVYVGDNPAKDFLWPNRLGWDTIMLKDCEGLNIHSQDISVADEYKAKTVIDNISNLIVISQQ